MSNTKKYKLMRGVASGSGLIFAIALTNSWFNQSRYNSNIETIFKAASQQHRVMKAPIRDFSGETFSLADLPQTPVLLDFWASWCPPCRVSMPELVELQARYGDKLIILAINIMEPEIDGLTYATKTNYDLRFVHSEKLAALFKVKVLPTKILLDANRNIIWAGTGHIPFLTQKWLESHI